MRFGGICCELLRMYQSEYFLVVNSVGTVMAVMFHVYIRFIEGPYRLNVYRR
jgi:hypothetical protein